MKKIFKVITKFLFGRLSIELARRWPLHFNILVMRNINEIQLSTEQLKYIAITIKEKAFCKLLIFGLGNDSLFWLKLNRGGVTVFLEDNIDWLQKITKRSKNLISFPVNYNTKITEWKMLLESPSLLDMELPDYVEKEEWDIIFVDAPGGWNDQTPGRMKSIYLASRLVKNSCDIFVHDCNREIEDNYCNKYLKKENLIIEIKTQGVFLRHYYITNNLKLMTNVSLDRDHLNTEIDHIF